VTRVHEGKPTWRKGIFDLLRSQFFNVDECFLLSLRKKILQESFGRSWGFESKERHDRRGKTVTLSINECHRWGRTQFYEYSQDFSVIDRRQWERTQCDQSSSVDARYAFVSRQSRQNCSFCALFLPEQDGLDG
jgi:hypothetical protein